MINTICLCGSTRFKDDFEEANRELTRRGFSVITLSFALEKDEQGNEKEPAVKELADLVHLNKILRSDAVLVVGDGYIGYSTCREMLWASMQGKPVVGQVTFTTEEHGTDWRALSHYLRYSAKVEWSEWIMSTLSDKIKEMS